jgi:3-dehydroquinate dehydratase-2
MKKFIIINGPNLNLTGIREPDIYGIVSFDDFLVNLRSEYPDIQIDYFQSNIEGEIINKLHETGFSYDGIILNAGGYTHTSIAIGDAVKSIQTSVVEVHLSNILAREDFRNRSMISAGVKGVISGFGPESYRLAILSLIKD